MSTNMELITSVTVGSGGAASITLPATGTIPQTYTDLMLVMSARTDRANIADGYLIKPNNTSPTVTYMTGDGSTAYSGTNYSGIFPAANATASTFGNAVAYFPNYANTSNNKSFSVDDVSENNASGAYATLSANLYSSTSAITTIVVQSINSTNIVEGSTFYLYGISNVTSTTKATGGIVSSDGTYNYHMFPYSGTFTPTETITADVLVVAGGAGGGNASSDRAGGGGGAGGMKIGESQSLTSSTIYTIIVGAGGEISTNGTSSSISGTGLTTISTTGGGAGANGATNAGAGSAGGSGGGGTPQGGAGGTGVSGEGNAGGQGRPNASNGAAGGGGGKGAVGNAASNNDGGNGGIGTNAYSSWANATQTGVNGYYAGGGGGGAGLSTSDPAGIGGTGGGGKGGGSNSGSVAGTVNTGGGGGGGRAQSNSGSAGGSGIVIIRYAI